MFDYDEQKSTFIDMLENYQAKNESKQKIKNKFIDFVKSNNDCFSRDNSHGHVTASAWLINNQKEVLLTHHKKLNKWLQLGGHCDGDPDVIGVAIKEAIEESGITDVVLKEGSIFDIDIHEIPENKKDIAHLHYDVRFLLYTTTKDYTVSNESNNLKWFTKKQLLTGELDLESSVMDMVEIWTN